MRRSSIFIGTSGWSNRSWTEFYPPGIKSGDYLNWYARSFPVTEINSSFYHIPRTTTIASWMAKVPAGFRFCPKLSRYITHIKKLKEPTEPLQKFMSVFSPMKSMLGPILIQLPPSLRFDAHIAEDLFQILQTQYGDFDFALEARHDSWYSEEARQLMIQYKIATVISESGGRFPYTEQLTARNVYLRFHGPDTLYNSSYPDSTLEKYAEKIKHWRKESHTVWVFFNNTMNHDALNNSRSLMHMLGLDK